MFLEKFCKKIVKTRQYAQLDGSTRKQNWKKDELQEYINKAIKKLQIDHINFPQDKRYNFYYYFVYSKNADGQRHRYYYDEEGKLCQETFDFGDDCANDKAEYDKAVHSNINWCPHCQREH